MESNLYTHGVWEEGRVNQFIRKRRHAALELNPTRESNDCRTDPPPFYTYKFARITRQLVFREFYRSFNAAVEKREKNREQ